MPLAEFDPLIQEWFQARFGAMTEPQQLGWPEIRAGRDVLISAPTGAGKTLAAFLTAIDALVVAARRGQLPNETAVLYVSPLKALGNDIHRNLDIPLQGVASLARAKGIPLGGIRAAVRTGDTPAAERQRMGNTPPHILVTTPESLFILLTAERSRKMLKSVRTLIVDEIHAIVDDKRGAHLALSIARLERLVGRPVQKIGLSATVSPLEEVARFLSAGAKIVHIGHRRAMDLAVEVPRGDLGAVASSGMWDEIYERLAELARQHRTTLVFVNTRRLSERVAHHLAERLGAGAVLPHHGSLSRKLRLAAEEKLKKGELRVVVATASLELGIDIGAVDLVCQIGSPRCIAVALQRAGRAGHWVGALPKARFFASTRDELIECAALVRAIRRGVLDKLEIPVAPLDILAQQIVAAAACEDLAEEELFRLVRRAWPYRGLSRRDFDQVLEMLSEGIAASRGRSGAFLHRDQVNHRVKGRRGARLAAITNGGAIPDTAQYQVVAEPEGQVIGSVDEDFAVESLVGDVFLMGASSWRIRRVEPGRVRVEDAHGAAPSIPFWNGEAPGRTRELSLEVSRLREDMVQRSPELACQMLIEQCSLDRRGAEQAVAYVFAASRALGVLPTQDVVVAERFFDEAGGMQLVLHAPFGSRINRAWGLALRKRFCRTFNFELQAAATDNGLVLSLSDQHSFPLEMVFGFLSPANLEHVLTQAMLPAPLFAARWKWNASRALAVPRFAGGRKVPPPIQRMRADDLLASVFPDQVACAENLAGEIRIPGHPLVKETIANCLYEAMDLNGLRDILGRLGDGSLRAVAIDTREPSPFCHEILNANPYAFLDDAPLEERRARAVQLRRTLPEDAASLAALDPAAIEQVARESWPVVRDADELHDALLTLVLLPPVDSWRPFYDSLARAGRARTILRGTRPFWTAAERWERALAAEQDPAAVLRGWMDSIAPATPQQLADRLALPLHAVQCGLAQLESEGQLLRGCFSQPNQFCNRRILARIHRLTLGRLRREIEPVSSALFMRFLCRWQHLAPGTQLHGVDGLFQILRQLQGFEISAAAWESSVLPRRLAGYEPEWLDRLCLSGEAQWGRLSPHPALEAEGARRVRPTRVAPVAVFLREDAPALLPPAPPPPLLSHPARDVLQALSARGALFFHEIARAASRLPSEVEDGLWELVAAGLVTADGFENLRALIDPKRRAGQGSARFARPRHAAGRWALLPRPPHSQPDAEFFAKLLLNRWGVVFRDIVAREALAPPWRDLLVAYRRLEARGEIRGGRFVAGFVGEQFARPEAVDLLRHLRRSAPSGEVLEIAPADPLNLTGIILPGARTGSLSLGSLRLLDGVPHPTHVASSGPLHAIAGAGPGNALS
ncbi:MAG TPA: DEAD/DEAH box helicase [Bryobacteraceae bacterium]|nr:DEAD/DEAH box helicase [Bryobacteraceae bacterium]